MTKSASILQSNWLAVAIILIIGGYLLIYDLGDGYLWQDEAETACVSRTVLQSGIPKGFDGVNYFSQQDGKEYGENYTWKLHPWFQFYWTATFFATLGESTFTARLPFALLGLGSALLGFFLSLMLWKDRKTAWFTAGFFAANTMFLLLTTQARYYGAVIFFSLYAVYGLLAVIQEKKHGLLHLVLGSFLLFHSHYLYALNFWGVSLVYVFLFERQMLKKVALTTIGLWIVCIPFMLWLIDTPYGSSFEIGSKFKEGFNIFTPYFFTHIFAPLWLVVPLLFYFFGNNFKSLKLDWKVEKPLLLFAGLIVGNMLILFLLMQNAFPRYLCGLLPFAFLIKGRLSGWLSQLHIGLPIFVLLIILFIGDFPKYISKINEDFKGPIEGMVKFIEETSSPDDVIGLGYGDLPLKFYLPNRIYGGLAADLPEDPNILDLIIIRQHPITDRDYSVTQFLIQHLDNNPELYKAYSINVQDHGFQNREVPTEHVYTTLKVNNPLVIHKKQ
ncbi:MAG: hypothetical protein GY810_29325 [Aureispira sp.]|nr:hypothetical protein [Aureispira sp.]